MSWHVYYWTDWTWIYGYCSGEPNNAWGNQDAVKLTTSNCFDDINGGTGARAVCQFGKYNYYKMPLIFIP